ncbi:anti-repressor SinI family protein [Bacillus infantis]
MTNLDKEWIELVASAKQLGLTIEDIRKFILSEQKEKRK